MKVAFLIGPVRQPILSLGKLNAVFDVYMKGGDGGKLYFPINNVEVEISKIQNSYYVPFVLSRPEDESPGLSQVRAIKMLHVEGNHVCFRERMGVDPNLKPDTRVEIPKEPAEGSACEEGKPTEHHRRRRHRRSRRDESKDSRDPPEKKVRIRKPDKEKGEEPRQESPVKVAAADKTSPSRPSEVREPSPLFSSSSETDYRPRGRSSDDGMEDVVEEPLPEASRSSRSERPPKPEWKPRRLMTEEERKRQNYEGRQAKKRKKADNVSERDERRVKREACWKREEVWQKPTEPRCAGSPAGTIWLDPRGWWRLIELELGDEEVAPEAAEVGEPSEPVDPTAEIKALAEGTGWKTTDSGDPVLVKAGAVVFQVPLAKYSRHILRTTWSRKDGVWTKVEDRVDWKTMDDPSGLIPNVGERLVTIFHKPEVSLSAEAGPSHLHPDSKVSDLKRRLKELHAPVWETKAQLWERLQEREAELEYHRSVERSKGEREEALNPDPEQARHPMVLEGPDPPSAVERELHELARLPFAPWCEACVRGRGKDMPHRKVEPAERRLMPMVCLGWFVAASSDEQGQKVEGATDVLLLTDAETGYKWLQFQPSLRVLTVIHIWWKWSSSSLD